MISNLSTPIRQRSTEEWQNVLSRRDIRPTRSMGQNFLIDPEIVRQIVEASGVGRGVEVVEVGPGLGILTRELLIAGCTVTAVELDRELAAFLRFDLGEQPQLTLIEADARHVDINSVENGVPWHLVANLPYSTGTVIIRHFLEMAGPPATSTVMVQKEVAERISAVAPEMSLLALAVQLFAEPSLAFVVPPEMFEPSPKVESAVIHLIQRPEPLLNKDERSHLFRVANLAFQQKRKTLANSLGKGLGLSKSDVEVLLSSVGIDSSLRPQAIGLSEWCDLARNLAK